MFTRVCRKELVRVSSRNVRLRPLSHGPAAAVPEVSLTEREHQHLGVASPVLEDSFGRVHNYLRISLTEKCNLRCQYCMPAEGVPLKPKNEMLTTNEIADISKLFVSKGVNKIRLTGGEPLIRRDILDICRSIGQLKGIRHLGITTNGMLLKRKLHDLEAAGVNMLNISLDTLVPEKFIFITRRKGFERVKAAIDEACEMGFAKVKVNCVVQRGFNDDELLDFVAWTEKVPIEIRFIEYMPFDGNKWNHKLLMPYFEIVDVIRSRWPEFQRERNRDGPNPTSKTWKVPGFRGSVGFISSMSDHFCGSCNRLRLTADGNLKPCLFGSREASLRDVIRNVELDEAEREAAMLELINDVVYKKEAKLGGHENAEAIARAESNRPMILIGG